MHPSILVSMHTCIVMFSHNILITSAVKKREKNQVLLRSGVCRSAALLWRAPGYLEGDTATWRGEFGKISPPHVATTLHMAVKPQLSNKGHILFKYSTKSRTNITWQHLSKSEAVEWELLHRNYNLVSPPRCWSHHCCWGKKNRQLQLPKSRPQLSAFEKCAMKGMPFSRNFPLSRVLSLLLTPSPHAKCKQTTMKSRKELPINTPDGVSFPQGAVFSFSGMFEIMGTPCPMAYGTVNKELSTVGSAHAETALENFCKRATSDWTQSLGRHGGGSTTTGQQQRHVLRWGKKYTWAYRWCMRCGHFWGILRLSFYYFSTSCRHSLGTVW